MPRLRPGKSRNTSRCFRNPALSFLIPCPNCGPRSAYDFRCGGEVLTRPQPGAPEDEWVDYFFYRNNTAGVHREWWYHKFGCRRWFLADRDTVTNGVVRAFWPEDAPQEAT